MSNFIELYRIEHAVDEKGNAKAVFVKMSLRKSGIDAILMPFPRTPNVVKEYDTAVTVRYGQLFFHVKESYEDILSKLNADYMGPKE